MCYKSNLVIIKRWSEKKLANLQNTHWFKYCRTKPAVKGKGIITQENYYHACILGESIEKGTRIMIYYHAIFCTLSLVCLMLMAYLIWNDLFCIMDSTPLFFFHCWFRPIIYLKQHSFWWFADFFSLHYLMMINVWLKALRIL